MVNFFCRIKGNTKFSFHESSDSFFELQNTVVGVSTIFWPINFLPHGIPNTFGCHFIIFADTKVEHFSFRMFSKRKAFGPLDKFKFIDLSTFSVTGPTNSFCKLVLKPRVSRRWARGTCSRHFDLSVRRRSYPCGNSRTQRIFELPKIKFSW